MRGFKGLLTGALALVLLQVLVSSGAGRVSGLLGVPGQIAQRFLDPTVPAIPDRRPAEPADDEPASRRYPDPFTLRPSRPPSEPGGE